MCHVRWFSLSFIHETTQVCGLGVTKFIMPTILVPNQYYVASACSDIYYSALWLPVWVSVGEKWFSWHPTHPQNAAFSPQCLWVFDAGLGRARSSSACVVGSSAARNIVQHMGIVVEGEDEIYVQRNMLKTLPQYRFTTVASHIYVDVKKISLEMNANVCLFFSCVQTWDLGNFLFVGRDVLWIFSSDSP